MNRSGRKKSGIVEQDEKAGERSNKLINDSKGVEQAGNEGTQKNKSSSASLPKFVTELNENDGKCLISALPARRVLL